MRIGSRHTLTVMKRHFVVHDSSNRVCAQTFCPIGYDEEDVLRMVDHFKSSYPGLKVIRINAEYVSCIPHYKRGTMDVFKFIFYTDVFKFIFCLLLLQIGILILVKLFLSF